MSRRRGGERHGLEGAGEVSALAAKDAPPLEGKELDNLFSRLVQHGTQKLWAVSEAAGARPERLISDGYGVQVSEVIPWESSATPIRDALTEVAADLSRFDAARRLYLAAIDMGLVELASAALYFARSGSGPARVYDRVLETGVVVTYCRPWSGGLTLPTEWKPQDPDERALHDELVRLRREYHAHTTYEGHRYLSDLAQLIGLNPGRPRFSEAWHQLDTTKIELLAELARKQAIRLRAEAERLDVELFGPLKER